MAQIRIPTQLRSLTGGERLLKMGGGTVAEVLDNLESKYPGFKKRILDEDGQPTQFIGIYVAGDDVRFLDGMKTALEDDAELSIVPASSGG